MWRTFVGLRRVFDEIALWHRNLPMHGVQLLMLCQSRISKQSKSVEERVRCTLTMERKRWPDAAASSDALGE
jgi:hypothetical protein